MNQYTISGNIGQDATIRQINDKYYVSFSVGVYLSKDNTLWVSVLVRIILEGIEDFRLSCSKGRKVLIQGRPYFTAYSDKVGAPVPSVTIFADTVDFLTPKKDEKRDVTGVDTTPKEDTRNEDEMPF